MSAALVELRNVSKAFPQSYKFWDWVKYRGRVPQRTALSDISFSVPPGEVFGLLGANGAGKTTVLKLMATIARPSSGQVFINGIDTQHNPLQARRSIGFAPADDRSFYYRLSARHNLRYFGTLADVPKSEIDRKIADVAQVVDLEADLDRRFSTFSKGMRQRLAVARALLTDPAVLLLDEPTHAVDPLHGRTIREGIRALARAGKTIVVSTNLIDEAWELCDRVAVLGGGRIVAIDSPLRLRNRAVTVQRYRIGVDRRDDDLLARVRATAGVLSADFATDEESLTSVDLTMERDDINALLQAVSCNGVRIRRVEPVDPNPVDVFRRLVDTRP